MLRALASHVSPRHPARALCTIAGRVQSLRDGDHDISQETRDGPAVPQCDRNAGENHPHSASRGASKAPDAHQSDKNAEENRSPGASQGARKRRDMKQSISASEIAKFAAMAETWWDSKGPFKPLHMMNPTRISFIRAALCRHFSKPTSCAKPLEGLRILDVGCGGGLLCEPLARLGAQVVGIDAVEETIKIATAHSIKDPLTASIEYVCTTSDQLMQQDQERFDVVIALEVIEHVTDPEMFMQSLPALVKPDGLLFLSTVNRSIRGYFLGILAAEHILGWVPKGTHEWSKFVTPDELALLMHQAGFTLEEMAGMVFNPLMGTWSLSEDTGVNYIAFGTKKRTSSE